MEDAELKALLNKNLEEVKALSQKASMFSKPVLVLSLLDCIFGILAIFCTSLNVIAFIASTASLTVITVCGRLVQVSKVKNLAKTLKGVNTMSLTWFVYKYKDIFKKEKRKVKTTKLSKIQIASIVGAGVGIAFGIVSLFVPQIAIAGDPIYNILVSLGIEGVSAFAGSFKGYAQKTAEEIKKAQDKINAKEQAEIEKEAMVRIKEEQKAQEAKKTDAELRAIAEHERRVAEAVAKIKAEQQNQQ